MLVRCGLTIYQRKNGCFVVILYSMAVLKISLEPWNMILSKSVNSNIKDCQPMR